MTEASLVSRDWTEAWCECCHQPQLCLGGGSLRGVSFQRCELSGACHESQLHHDLGREVQTREPLSFKEKNSWEDDSVTVTVTETVISPLMGTLLAIAISTKSIYAQRKFALAICTHTIYCPVYCNLSASIIIVTHLESFYIHTRM